MALRDDLLASQTEITRKLAILNSIGEDTFPFGTVMVFNAATGAKWYYVKIAEERWQKLGTSAIEGPHQRPLSEWIFYTEESPIGYFEVYELRVQPAPFYASAD